MNEKVLIIDDDPSMIRLIEHALQSEGYDVISAANGLQGLKKARTEQVDLIILDVMLPGVDGFEVCHRLKDEPDTAGVLILMLSGKGEDRDKVEATNVGADAYMTKPTKPPELCEQVRELLNRKSGTKD